MLNRNTSWDIGSLQYFVDPRLVEVLIAIFRADGQAATMRKQKSDQSPDTHTHTHVISSTSGPLPGAPRDDVEVNIPKDDLLWAEPLTSDMCETPVEKGTGYMAEREYYGEV